MSTYNGERYLEATLASVAAQTLRDYEFIVLEDGSKDGTQALLERHAKADPRLKLFPNPKNRGVGYCYARMLEKASGEVIACVGQDDLWDPEFLARCLAVLEAKPEVSAVFSRVRIIGPEGEARPAAESPFLIDLAAARNRREMMILLIKHNFFCAGAAMFRTKDIRDWHPLGENDQYQDWNTWQHLILKGEFHYLPETLASYRVHGGNLSLAALSPTQVALEAMQTRLEMIGSPLFAEYVKQSPEPNDLFFAAMQAFGETMNPNNPTQYFCLLQALRKNEPTLRDLPAFQDLMNVLFLYMEAYGKFHRYCLREDRVLGIPAGYWNGFDWRYLVCLAKPGLPPINSTFLRTRKVGPFYVLKVLARRGRLAKFGFRRDGKSASLIQLLERHLAVH